MTDETTVGSTIREERRPLTALFADLVGSTALAERLDEAEARLIVGEAIARIVEEVERVGGYVKDLAGDGVLAFFGAPTASEDDAERALLAALAIVDAMRAYGGEVARGWDIDGFGVRVGVTTGPVVVGAIGAGARVEYAAFGDTVNTAARLQGAAEPGTILVDETTRRLAEPLFDWGDPRELRLKGKQLPVTAHRLLRSRPDGEKPRGLAGVESRLVGREAELDVVRRALADVARGKGGVLLVTGEAGIGKSRLLLESRAGYGGLWLEGRCVSYGESLPYWPFRDLLREWLGAGLDDPELRVRVSLRRAVSELFGERELEVYPYLCSLLGIAPEPEAVARLADLSPEALQYRTFEVVEALLERLAQDQPVTVLIDDLHWADATSVQLIERLLSVGERAAVLLVLIQRDDRDHPSWAVRERAAREVPHLVTEVALAPLAGDAQLALLESMVGAEVLPFELEERVLAAAEGNPFYLEELVRSLIDLGALVRDDGGWRLDHNVSVEVPPTVERVILARIDRLGPVSHGILTAASALGRRFGLALLTAILDEEAVDDALHELQRLDLLRATRRWPEPEYRFKHALIQESAYRTLLPQRRRELHRRAAEWLERQYPGTGGEVLGLLAHHWLAAKDESKAISYLTRAGDEARLAWSLDEAIEHYRNLLALLERRGERQEMALVLFKLGLALHTALRFGEANDVYRRAFEVWEPPSTPPGSALLRFRAGRIPLQVDPPRSYMLVDMQAQMALFDRLVERWPEATIVPSLAERWEIADDGLRYVFRLRDGVVWSDGTPLTAHDVVYGVRRNLDRERPGVSVAMLFALENAQDYFRGRTNDLEAVGVRALDDRTVEFRLVTPAPYFLSMLNRPDAGPQPRHAIEAFGSEWTTPERIVTSGAFTLVEMGSDRVALQRRKGSVPRIGNVARVEMVRSTPDELSSAYERDEIDLAWGDVAWEASKTSPVPAEELRMEPAAGTGWLYFDFRNAAVESLALRKALAHAVDRAELASHVSNNLVVATGGMVPPLLQGHTPDIAPRHDPDLARRLLGESGFDGELIAQIPEPVDRYVLTVLERWERVLGVTVRVVATGAGPAAISYAGWYPGYPDPEYFLRLLLHSEAKDNFGAFAHAPYDELVERARAEPDGRRRLDLFHAADRMAVAEQVAVIPLVYFRNVALVKPWVHGWWEYGKSWSSFADLVVDERA